MIKLLFLPLLLLTSLFACSDSSSTPASADNSASGGTLYLRTFWWAMNNTMEISWIYLGNDGSIVKNPKHGNAPVKVAEEKKDNAEYTGTYKVSGSQMTVTWSNGKQETWEVQKKGGLFTALNKGPVTVAQPLPATFRFEKEFPAYDLFPEENLLHFLQFHKDGTCTFKKFVNAPSSIPDQTQGTYSINKNTLTVNLGGRTAVANIGLSEGGKRVIIGTNYQEL